MFYEEEDKIMHIVQSFTIVTRYSRVFAKLLDKKKNRKWAIGSQARRKTTRQMSLTLKQDEDDGTITLVLYSWHSVPNVTFVQFNFDDEEMRWSEPQETVIPIYNWTNHSKKAKLVMRR